MRVEALIDANEAYFTRATRSAIRTGRPMAVYVLEQGSARFEKQVEISAVDDGKAHLDRTCPVVLRRWITPNRDMIPTYRRGALPADGAVARLRPAAS